MADLTPNYKLKKPSPDEFYDVDVFNDNMDIIDEVVGDFHKTRSMKTFTSLNEIGLTAGSETIADIVNALPDGSALMVATDANHNMSIYPKEHYGLLIVFKRTVARTMFLYSSYGSGFYYGYYYSVNDDWSDWQSFLKTTGGTVTGDFKIASAAPNIALEDTSDGSGTKIHKNAGGETDYGTYISDIDKNGIQDILILRRAGSTNADKLLLRIYSEDGTSSETYKIYHEGNKPKPADIDALSCAGGTVRSAITFQKPNINNGSGRVVKNHSAESDYGMVVSDTDANGNTASLIVQARTDSAYFSPKAGGTYKLYSEYNKPTPADIGALPSDGNTLKAGDVLPVTINTAGILTSNGAQVQFTVPLSKSVIGSPKITPKCNNGFMLLQGGKYTHGTSSSARAFPDTFTASYVDGVGVRLVATFSDKTNAVNNDTIAIYWHGRLEFE